MKKKDITKRERERERVGEGRWVIWKLGSRDDWLSVLSSLPPFLSSVLRVVLLRAARNGEASERDKEREERERGIKLVSYTSFLSSDLNLHFVSLNHGMESSKNCIEWLSLSLLHSILSLFHSIPSFIIPFSLPSLRFYNSFHQQVFLSFIISPSSHWWTQTLTTLNIILSITTFSPSSFLLIPNFISFLPLSLSLLTAWKKSFLFFFPLSTFLTCKVFLSLSLFSLSLSVRWYLVCSLLLERLREFFER